MRVTADMEKLEETIKVLDSMYQHRKARPLDRSDELWCQLNLKFYSQVKAAQEAGKPIIASHLYYPCEIIYALDLVPMPLEVVSSGLVVALRLYEEVFNAAKGFGLPVEPCSNFRIVTGSIVRGWLPRPQAIVWNHGICDNPLKTGGQMKALYNLPGFFVDVPYLHGPREVAYLIQELEESIHFLEEVTGRKMDWGRLRQAVELSHQMDELHREISELRKAIPAPCRSRKWLTLNTIDYYFAGTPEGVSYYQCVRDEVKERAENQQGVVPQERYRLLTIHLPPNWLWRIMDWMEREHGAVSVAETYWLPGEERDSDSPLEFLARKQLFHGGPRVYMGPLQDRLVKDAVDLARDYRAHGAVFYAHAGCRQSCACIRTVKDALMEEAGIPTLVLDCDMMDPTYVTEEQLKEKLEGFFEVLRDSR